MQKFYPAFQKMLDRRTKVLVITRNPSDLDPSIRDIATNEIMQMSEMGVSVTLLKGNHHRKLAIIDRSITWEGSLNILSQNNSMEIMRRIEDKKTTEDLMKFLKLKV
jgi:phosphatidylserine/phosphatidylglycerophosphate/cardiolipin synthase-like enzyme